MNGDGVQISGYDHMVGWVSDEHGREIAGPVNAAPFGMPSCDILVPALSVTRQGVLFDGR